MRCYRLDTLEEETIFIPLGIRRLDFINQTLPVLNDPDRQKRIDEYRHLAEKRIDLQERMNEHRLKRKKYS